MATPTFLQSNTAASDSSASTTHQIALPNPVASQGGAVCPSALVLQISYDGNTGEQVSSITDSAGNTWVKAQDDAGHKAVASDGAGTNGELWVAFSAIGGVAPTITVNMSSSVKAKLAVAELDQIAPVSPLDGTSNPIDRITSRINTTSSTQRNSADTTGGAGYTTKRRGMIEVTIGGISWNNTRTATTTTPWTGGVILSGSASNLGVGLERKTAEIKNITPTNSIARFIMSGVANTDPAAVMCVTFFRDAVQTSASSGAVLDQDGMIDNVEGVEAIYTNTSPDLVYMSSASAPNGGTGGSEKTNAFAFFPRWYGPPGATIGENMTLFYNVTDAFEDGTGNFFFQYYFWKDAELGSTLNSGDANPVSNYLLGYDRVVNLGTEPTVAGERSVAMQKSTDWNPTGVTNGAMSQQGDGGGSATSTYTDLNEYSGNVPQYIVLQLTYPVIASAARRGRLLRLANAPRLTLQRVRR